MTSHESASHSNALDVFADWISRRERGETVAFEEVLRRHPGLASELVELEETWKRLAAAGDPERHSLSLHERLASRFGEESAPEITLREGAEAKETGGDFSSAVVAQLATRGSGFGRYKIRGEVARGGMGAILKIWDEDLRRHLAMKVILGQAEVRSSGSTPPVASSTVARFLEEAQVTGQLDHPGIVPVHELGLDPEGRLYFTMKLVKGKSLKDVFDLVAEQKEGWTETKALGVLLRVCEAMAYAHDKGVIHRDLKPGNVMVGKFGEVHVMDWGLARILDREDAKNIRIREELPGESSMRSTRDEHRGDTPDSPLFTMDGDVVGTPAYMPPEQAAGKLDEVGPHSDVYALGAMIYHLLAGHMPYVPRGAKLNNYAIWGLVQQGPPTSIALLSPKTPAELAAICDKAMARDWKQRYRDMSELAADLSAYLEHRVVGAYESGTWAETRKWIERNQSLAASLAAAIVILVAGVIGTTSFAVDAKHEAVRADAKTAEAEHNASEARRNESRAVDQEQIATQRASELAVATKTAQENEKLATQRANDVLSLSAIQELKELIERADTLWPALPSKVPEYDRWLEQAKVLIDGRVADPARGIEAHLALEDHETKLAEIRARAKPMTAAELDADRRAAPQFAELEQARAKLTWVRRMLGEEPWPSEADVEAVIAKEGAPRDAADLIDVAWPFVDPDPAKVVYGSEVKALLLARRAIAAANDTDRASAHDLLACALFRCGHIDEALPEERRAIELADDEVKKGLTDSNALLERRVGAWKTPQVRSKQHDAAEALAAHVAELERAVNERRAYEFDDARDRWWQGQLALLVADLKAFADEKTGLYSAGVSPEHGWGMVKRRRSAATMEELSTRGTEAQHRWMDAASSIAKSAEYGGLELTPQIGLVPIGEDPDSHLWEFAAIDTGDVPERGADGTLIKKDSMALVFVLIPPGQFWMGAQSTDPHGHNYDAEANATEVPLREVKLDAYFFSKFEMTQGQWQCLTGRNPSQCHPGISFGGKITTLLHPVEQVSWIDCAELASRAALLLPTEAQWEYAARAGTETSWWSGADAHSLAGTSNLADSFCKNNGGPSSWRYEDWLDDGFVTTAPVGSFRPNAFGLHDMLGNVWEWCRDEYLPYKLAPRAGDGERVSRGVSIRVNRGGSFGDAALAIRSAARNSGEAESRAATLGFRPARSIER